MRQYSRGVAVAVALMLAFPSAARPDPPDRFVFGNPMGTLRFSLADGTVTGDGPVLDAGGLGAIDWSLELSLAPVVGQPLCRQASGTMRWTKPSGHYLLLSVFGGVCYDPNARLFLNDPEVFRLKVIDGTGRFEGWTGTGVWGMVGSVDDSGVAATLTRSTAELDIARR